MAKFETNPNDQKLTNLKTKRSMAKRIEEFTTEARRIQRKNRQPLLTLRLCGEMEFGSELTTLKEGKKNAAQLFV
jgi:hypothetical protein